jgi:hypothetical protein
MTLSPPEIEELLALMRAHGAAEVEIAAGDRTLRLALRPAAPLDRLRTVPAGATLGSGHAAVPVLAGGVGRFLPRHPAGEDDLASPGTPVQAGDVLEHSHVCWNRSGWGFRRGAWL